MSKESSTIRRNPVGFERKSRIPSLNRSKTLLNIKVDSTGKGTKKPEYENVVLFRNSKSSEKLEEIAQKEARDDLIPLPKFNQPKSNVILNYFSIFKKVIILISSTSIRSDIFISEIL